MQIAVLARWLRAQKAFGVKAGDRAPGGEVEYRDDGAHAGEESIRRESIEGLQPKVLGQLLEIVFKKMELAGEAGSLLVG